MQGDQPPPERRRNVDTAPRHVDAHHIKHWADGGETSVDNLLLLCRHHHRLVHEGGYGLQLDEAGNPEFTSPQGELIAAAPETRSRGNVFALTHTHQQAELGIGPRSLLPNWRGERMDDSMAVEALLQRE